MPNAKEDEESFSGLHEQRGDPMRIWNATTLVWTEEYGTDIKISDWWDRNARSKPHHSISCIRMTLQPDGTGDGSLVLNGRSRSGLCNKDYHIVLKRLQNFKAQGITFTWHMSYPNYCAGFADFTFEPQKNTHFTDRAITIARQIAEALGLSGENLENYLARFKVYQQTRVHINGKWIGFADYLRIKHGMANLSGTGWGDS